MQPKFLEVIKLGVLLGAIALAVAFILHGPGDTQQVLHSMSSDGVAGWLSTGLFLLKWMLYGFIFVVFACGLCLLLNALGVLTTIAEKIIGGMASVMARTKKIATPTPDPVDLVVARRRDGKPITLGEMLNGLSAKVRALEAKTAGLEPPPPPKSAEETIAELQAELARLKAKPVAAAPSPVVEARS